MSKKRAFVRYSKNGKIVPGSLILTAGSYPYGPSTWKEVSADLCCSDIPSNCVELTVNTDEGGLAKFNLTTNDPTTYTIYWGDGQLSQGWLDGSLDIAYSYPVTNKNYTVNVCFANPLAVGEFILGVQFFGGAKFTSITGLQNLSNLTLFAGASQSLQTVNLSNLPSLTSVDVTSNPSLSSIDLTGSTAVTAIYLAGNDFSTTQLGGIIGLSALVNLEGFYISNDIGLAGVVDVSNLPALRYLTIDDNPLVTSIIISDTQPIVAADFTSNALTQTAVDNILVELSTNGVLNGNANLRFPSNAIPSATGLAAKTVLEGNGWTVLVNS